MTESPQEQVERLRKQVQDMLRRVPASVNAGSYDTAVAYKKLAKKAIKLVEMKTPKYVDLQTAINEFQQYQ